MGDSVLIKGGTLVSKDHDSVQSDVLITGERIVSIASNIPVQKGWKTIDAAGKIVAPGFMSIHSHDDFYLPLKEHPQLLKSVLTLFVMKLQGQGPELPLLVQRLMSRLRPRVRKSYLLILTWLTRVASVELLERPSGFRAILLHTACIKRRLKFAKN